MAKDILLEALNGLQDSFIPKDTKTAQPFSNSSEAFSWRAVNCDICDKYEGESQSPADAKCKLGFFMDLAFVVGVIPLNILQEIGIYDDRIISKCSKFETEKQ